MAPVLFSLYFGAVVNDWRSKCLASGVEFRYKLGRKLVGDRTAKSRLLSDAITESQQMMLHCIKEVLKRIIRR